MRGCFALSRDSARRKRLNKYVCPDSILHKSHELDQRTRALLQNRVRKKQRYLVSGCQNSPCVYTFGKVWEGWFGRWQACTRAEEKFDERRALFLLAKRTDLQLHVLRFQLYQLLRRAFALAQGKEIGSASRCGIVRVVRDEGVEIAHWYKCDGLNSRLVEHFLPEGKSGEACSAPLRRGEVRREKFTS